MRLRVTTVSLAAALLIIFIISQYAAMNKLQNNQHVTSPVTIENGASTATVESEFKPTSPQIDTKNKAPEIISILQNQQQANPTKSEPSPHLQSSSPIKENESPNNQKQQHKEPQGSNEQNAEEDTSNWKVVGIDQPYIQKEALNYDVHVFYYAWYASKEHDGKWSHWNHELIPHWNQQIASQYPRANYAPENDDVGASYFPQLGPYSSRDPKVLDEHMRMISSAKIGVIVLSWWGQAKDERSKDSQGDKTDPLVPSILNAADKYQVKVAFHLEPYEGRDALRTREDVIYVIQQYGNHPAFYRDKKRNNKPVFYVYDSYRTPANKWAEVLSPNTQNSIRNTPYDSIMISLLVDQSHFQLVKDGNFDGLYTYFASDIFVWGSSPYNWEECKRWCNSNNKIFVPSVGVGYDDTRVRPWNEKNTRERGENGEYYDNSFKAALSTKPKIISITSFNEWHEGTQIEPAIPKTITRTVYPEGRSYTYRSYEPHDPEFYLQKTKKWIQEFERIN